MRASRRPTILEVRHPNGAAHTPGAERAAAAALLVLASLLCPADLHAQSSPDLTNYTGALAHNYPLAFSRYLSELPAGLHTLPWLRHFERDTNGPVRSVTVAGRVMLWAFACVPHNCANNSLDLLFSPDQARVVGLVHLETKANNERVVTIGEPTPDEAACLRNPPVGALESPSNCPAP